LKLCAHDPFASLAPTVECEGELSNEANDCYVIDGNLTLYSRDPIVEVFLNGLRDIIRVAMTNGVFNEVDPRIVKVTYRENLGDPDAANSQTASGGGKDDSLPAVAWVFIGLGAAAALVVLGVVFSRRRKPNAEDGETGSFPGSPVTAEPVV
jgi:hypothetical protein